ncbi:MAG: asparagine synthase (glutamine-hydrolyzing) [Candidatus Omnitrophota bacterium]
MCGICGIKGLSLEKRNRFIDDMLGILYHRGPDEKGKHLDENISLGIRRLSIIGLKMGSQTIFNEDKSLAVVCNGELYNFYLLKDNLIKKGHIFYTDTDSEVLVHLYEEYGPNCLKYIKGMFAFALWDKVKKRLFIARDRFGIKPLYYYNKDGIFAFSSELKALLKLPFIEKKLDSKALDLYFSLEYVPCPYSIFKNIHKLKPAHYIFCKDNNVEVQRYWNLGECAVNNKISFYEAKEELKNLLYNSVKEHLISDVPLGVFLSGGIDSISLAVLAKKSRAQRLSTFSIGFKEKTFDESRYAFLAAKYLGTSHYAYTFTIDDFIGSFHEVTSLLDEPFADMSIFPTYFLSKFSRKHIKVALSGEGADELFMGYPTYIAHKYIKLFNKFPQMFQKISKRLIDLLPASDKYFSIDFKLKQFIRGANIQDLILRHLLWMGAFSSSEKECLFNRSIGCETVDDFAKSFRDLESSSCSRIIQHLDISTYLCDDLLVKSDRAGMFSSLEVRVPYLDHQLVEFTLSLRPEFIYQKKLLKEAMAGILPKQILSRPKKGFPIPFSDWLRDKKFFGIVEEFFNKNFIIKQNIFNYDYVNYLFNEHLSGKRDNRKKIRTYLMFQAWYVNYKLVS